VPIYALGDVEPEIHPDASVHPDAVVIGNLTHTVHIKGDNALISSGSMVSLNAEVPDRRMALGAPARMRTDHEVPEGATEDAVQSYIQRSTRFRAGLRLLER